MPSDVNPPADAAAAAAQLATHLTRRSYDYALGGALALGYWAEPRGTLDVDLTLFVPPDKPSEVISQLQDVGCELMAAAALASLQEHGFCRVLYGSVRVDVFVPMIPFYEQARLRRRSVYLGEHQVNVWDAETLCVFKMMFFRRKDLADVEQILRNQGAILDRPWVRARLVEIYGQRDARITRWDELIGEVPAA